jgi:hypothetical protein
MKHLHWTLLIGLLLSVTVGLAVPMVFADDPAGSGPLDPLTVRNNSWQTIAPNTSLWFYFDYTGDRSKVEVALNNYGVSNVRFAIYTPAQAEQWLRGESPAPTPVGLGTKPGGAEVTPVPYDLVWLGAFNFPGRFFIVVTNDGTKPASYRLTVTGTSITMYPTPTLTLVPTPIFSTPVPVSTIPGRFVFQQASGGSIYTVNGDGTQLKRITSGFDPAWSPDAKQITFSRWDTPAGLFIANADGSEEQRIFDAPQIVSPRWSPDGKRIAFARQKGGMQQEQQFCFRGFCFTTLADPYWKLGMVELNKPVDDTTKTVVSDVPSTNHAFAPTWSRDNRILAYTDAGFGILTTDTMSNTIVTLYSKIPKVQAAAWSPDGARIAYQVSQHDHWEIGVMNADGSYPTNLTWPNPLAFGVVNNVAPTWSPDGKEILFLSDRNGKWEFFVITVESTNLRQVLKDVTDALGIGYNFSNERMVDWTR